MDDNVKALAEKLLQAGYDDLPEREQRVLRRIAKRSAMSRNLNTAFQDQISFGQRLADKVAEFGGSWTFIIIFGTVLATWVLLNSSFLPKGDIFDPYP